MRSDKFFYAVIAFFIFESGWIALSSNYPMAFDEDFHFGIIKLYAAQWSPFFSQQPVGGNAFGALTRDPSFLFHYLMSFPYRITTLFTSSQIAEIIVLRFIDIGLFAWGLVLFRKLLLKTKAPTGMVHTTLLFFTLVPVVPLLAGQINYDDLLVPLVALSLLLTMQFKEQLNRDSKVHAGLLIKLLATCLISCMVQFEFLPIFIGISLYVIFSLWKFSRHHVWRLKSVIWKSWQRTRQLSRLGYIALLLVSVVLFSRSYLVNLVAYKDPVPQCNQVLSITQCSSYSPWLRNYLDAQNKTSVDINPLPFSAHWLHDMFFNSFFVSSGGGDNAAYYVHVPPLPIISITAIVIFGGGILLILWYRKSLFKNYPMIGFLTFVSIVYCLVLWTWNYQDFLHLGDAVALNGRYLFPIMPPILLLIALAYREWFSRRQTLQVALLAIVFVLFLQGGGLLTFIDASNSHWYWLNNKTVESMNHLAQKIVKPLIIS